MWRGAQLPTILRDPNHRTLRLSLPPRVPLQALLREQPTPSQLPPHLRHPRLPGDNRTETPEALQQGTPSGNDCGKSHGTDGDLLLQTAREGSELPSTQDTPFPPAL